MLGNYVILLTFITTTTNGALLFWSKTPFQVSPLINFNDNDLDELKVKMGNPTTQIYKTTTPLLSADFKQILNGHYSYYNPNGDLNNLENASEISGDDLQQIKQNVANDNVLSVVVLPKRQRFKRDIIENTDMDATVNPSIGTNTGPVLYKAKDKNDESTYILMYSTQSLLLKVNDSNHQIGETSEEMITIDNRGNFVKFSVKVPSEDLGKITLNFLFTWYGNYWQMNSVKITDMNNNYNFNLTIENINNNIIVPEHFSYHCSGNTIFSDYNNSVELYIKDMQVQIDAKNGKFNDAYDCIPFTTAPIWSGLMVTAIIGIGLIVGLTAMLDIKTMDKFDNHKTKQLTINVVE